MATFSQTLFTGQNKTAATSIAITGSKTVTVGNLIAVAFGCDDVGSAFGCTDNLGNTYTLQNTGTAAGSGKAMLFTAPVTAGGTLTTITVAWTTNVTAKAAVSAEFGPVGTLRLTDATGFAAGTSGTARAISSNTFFTDELWVGAFVYESASLPGATSSSGIPSQTTASGGSIATAGGGDAANIAVTLGYYLISGNSSVNTALESDATTTTRAKMGAGAIFNPAANVPRNPAINLTAPALLMKARDINRRWRHGKSGIIVPDGVCFA